MYATTLDYEAIVHHSFTRDKMIETDYLSLRILIVTFVNFLY